MIEEMKSVFSEKHHFEHRDGSRLQTFLAIGVNQDSNAGVDMVVSRPILSKMYIFLIATLVEKIKPVFMKILSLNIEIYQ